MARLTCHGALRWIKPSFLSSSDGGNTSGIGNGGSVSTILYTYLGGSAGAVMVGEKKDFVTVGGGGWVGLAARW